LLAQIIGVQRNAISIVAHALQQARPLQPRAYRNYKREGFEGNLPRGILFPTGINWLFNDR